VLGNLPPPSSRPPTPLASAPLLRRLWRYQAERFPLVRHGPLILVFSGGAVGYGARLAGSPPRALALAVACAVLLLQFLLMRLADEFKDDDDDRRWRPERAVPRGLVHLRELAGLGLVAAALQFALVAALIPAGLPWLAAVWGWFLLMGAEFFRRDWLRARPGLYALSHLPIVPLLALLAVRLQIGGPLPLGRLLPFLGCCYAGAMLIELARKIQAPPAERPGVESYSAVWGFRPALAIWTATLALSALLALAAAVAGGGEVWLLPLAPLLALALAQVGPWLTGRSSPSRRRAEEPLASLTALWILATYLGLGWLPWAGRLGARWLGAGG
jgi:4-hydroxybenzoate polyprenyltransferase